MHLHHPSLSLAGKRKGKVKFRNAEEARKARELAADWQELQKKWGVEAEEKKRRQALQAEPLSYTLSTPPGRSSSKHIPSRGTGFGVAVSKPQQKYTGTLIKGIATMHKSNAVPILNDEQAVEISHMRR